MCLAPATETSQSGTFSQGIFTFSNEKELNESFLTVNNAFLEVQNKLLARLHPANARPRTSRGRILLQQFGYMTSWLIPQVDFNVLIVSRDGYAR